MKLIDTLCASHTGRDRYTLLHDLAHKGNLGTGLAAQLHSASYQLENLETLLRQAIGQAITDLIWARTAVDHERFVDAAGILQRNGQQVDQYAAKVAESTTLLRALFTLTAELLPKTQP